MQRMSRPYLGSMALALGMMSNVNARSHVIDGCLDVRAVK
jgi:hypothetical protein